MARIDFVEWVRKISKRFPKQTGKRYSVIVFIKINEKLVKSWHTSGMTIQDAVTNIRRELEKGNSR